MVSPTSGGDSNHPYHPLNNNNDEGASSSGIGGHSVNKPRRDSTDSDSSLRSRLSGVFSNLLKRSPSTSSNDEESTPLLGRVSADEDDDSSDDEITSDASSNKGVKWADEEGKKLRRKVKYNPDESPADTGKAIKAKIKSLTGLGSKKGKYTVNETKSERKIPDVGLPKGILKNAKSGAAAALKAPKGILKKAKSGAGKAISKVSGDQPKPVSVDDVLQALSNVDGAESSSQPLSSTDRRLVGWMCMEHIVKRGMKYELDRIESTSVGDGDEGLDGKVSYTAMRLEEGLKNASEEELKQVYDCMIDCARKTAGFSYDYNAATFESFLPKSGSMNGPLRFYLERFLIQMDVATEELDRKVMHHGLYSMMSVLQKSIEKIIVTNNDHPGSSSSTPEKTSAEKAFKPIKKLLTRLEKQQGPGPGWPRLIHASLDEPLDSLVNWL